MPNTTDVFYNQLSVPTANYLLCLGTMLVAAVTNNNTTALSQTYSVSAIAVRNQYGVARNTRNATLIFPCEL